VVRDPEADLVTPHARAWVGTPFRLHGRDATGIDCFGLILRVGWTLGLPLPDATGYGMAGDGPRLRTWLEANLVPLRTFSDAGPGDVVALRLRLGWEHVGLLGWLHGSLSLVHVHTLARRAGHRRLGWCVEHGWVPPWSGRLAAVYRYRGTTAWRH
jgi:cell wall-associated NlpC family hydrolase